MTETLTVDEGIREGTTAEVLANLKPAFSEDGKITAGNSSQISDGAAALLIMSEEKAAELGMKARARFHSFALAGTDPVTMLLLGGAITALYLLGVGLVALTQGFKAETPPNAPPPQAEG